MIRSIAPSRSTRIDASANRDRRNVVAVRATARRFFADASIRVERSGIAIHRGFGVTRGRAARSMARRRAPWPVSIGATSHTAVWSGFTESPIAVRMRASSATRSCALGGAWKSSGDGRNRCRTTQDCGRGDRRAKVVLSTGWGQVRRETTSGGRARASGMPVRSRVLSIASRAGSPFGSGFWGASTRGEASIGVRRCPSGTAQPEGR
jgi:hypothetical protein